MHCILLSDRIGNCISKWSIYTTPSGGMAHPIRLFCAVSTDATVSNVPKLLNYTKYILLVGSKAEGISHRHGEGKSGN